MPAASTRLALPDRYRVVRHIANGGMATVQLAFDTRLERNVAVKLLAEHLADDSSFVSRFRREALAAARLVHPNIVFFEVDDAPAKAAALAGEGIDLGAFGPRRIRAVTHLDVDRDGIERALQAMRRVL